MDNNKIKICTLFFLLVIKFLFAQEIIIDNFNNDKKLDTCYVLKERGFVDISIPSINFNLSHSFSSSSIIDTICVDTIGYNKLSSTGKQKVLKYLYLDNYKTKADPSMDFLLSLKKDDTINEKNIFYYKPYWTDSLPIPRSYYLKSINSGLENCFIKNNGHNLKFLESFKLDNLKLHIYTHGIVLEKGNKFSWCFIGDESVNMNIEKLRWSSIHFVSTISNKNEFIISQKTIPNEVNSFYKINYMKGVIELLFSSTQEVQVDITSNCIEFNLKNSKKTLKKIDI